MRVVCLIAVVKCVLVASPGFVKVSFNSCMLAFSCRLHGIFYILIFTLFRILLIKKLKTNLKNLSAVN